ncbi:MAG: hypothetical protein HGA96_13515 [Desulfobulbaceae bacterium]|nr:hypothetical protein [Desulfobulbaceae bacterium]
MKSKKLIILILWLSSFILLGGYAANAGPAGGNFTVFGGGVPNAGTSGGNYTVVPGGGIPNSGPAGVNLIPMKQKMAFVSLEALEAEFFPASRLVSVKGSLKNISSSSLRGYITISLLSQSGVVLAAFDMQVNDHRPFTDGETVPFDTAVNVSSLSGAFRVSVEFTKD